MLTQPYQKIFSKKALHEALDLIKSKGSGLDKESLDAFKKQAKNEIDQLHVELMGSVYAPQPIEKIAIAKNKTEKRPIALASVRDKVVQRALVNVIEPHFDKLMSNKSYGYRHDKSTLKAIGRCRDYINRGYFWVYKTDIDNYFETINHDTLLNILDKEIADKKIVRLISLYLQNGGFKQANYVEHDEGVHQGDILSPLLSNIYLSEMDRFLERKGVEFVRYADDFVLFFKKKGRENKGATDLVNASLNYGYAILYARVQNALLKAGLALHISFLHSLQEGKPTLVYDFIEEFRAFVVDRAIVSMINKNEPLKINSKGELSKASCHLIVQNVKERLGVYTQHKKASKKVETILQDQAYLLARHVRGEETYKPFIGKY